MKQFLTEPFFGPFSLFTLIALLIAVESFFLLRRDIAMAKKERVWPRSRTTIVLGSFGASALAALIVVVIRQWLHTSAGS